MTVTVTVTVTLRSLSGSGHSELNFLDSGLLSIGHCHTVTGCCGRDAWESDRSVDHSVHFLSGCVAKINTS
jgi:hypothetical protein